MDLKVEEAQLLNRIKDLEFRNSLLSDKLDLDYVEDFNQREIFVWQRGRDPLYN